MRADLLEARPTLRAWLDEYAAIEADYLARLADWGIRIASRDADADVVRAAKDRLREKGAQFRNGDAGIVESYISYLRRKIDPHTEESLIQTKRGFGYMLKVGKTV